MTSDNGFSRPHSFKNKRGLLFCQNPPILIVREGAISEIKSKNSDIYLNRQRQGRVFNLSAFASKIAFVISGAGNGKRTIKEGFYILFMG